MALIKGEPIKLHGKGVNTRHYLCATDFAAALAVLAKRDITSETFNIGSPDEFTNIEVARMICDAFGVDPQKNIRFVADRPFNDRRYAISWQKITDLGWKPKDSLPKLLPEIVAWYKKNSESMQARMNRASSYDHD
jgi:UDP-glucose 4,6-dehydratase